MKTKKSTSEEEISLPFSQTKISGKFKNESCIAYSLSLPHLPFPEFEEAEAFLSRLSDCFLSYLEEKSKEKSDFVRFGGISFREEGQRVQLSACLSPFDDRRFFPVATLHFTKEGKLSQIEKAKKARKGSS